MDVERFSYVGVLLFVVFGSIWLEVFLRTRVLRRWRRLLPLRGGTIGAGRARGAR